jgi:hypothetical protein
MLERPELAKAFDKAIKEVGICRASGMTCADGSSAAENLERLNSDLVAERSKALERGSVDKEWVQTTVRWLVAWVPETELTLIAALGRIARANHPGIDA